MAAESTTPSGVTMSTGKPDADRVDDKGSKVKPEKPEKPEKPDEEKYKTDLAKAEKEHAAVQERLVRLLLLHRCSCPQDRLLLG